MNRFIVGLLSLALGITAHGQKSFFAYLQTETEEPFFLRMNDKTYSSTASGYLILSQLKDSTYNFKIGFPGNKWPEQKFQIALKGKDRGYLVKNFGEKGWGLFDLQTLTVTMADADKGSGRNTRTEAKEVSAFTQVLSKAANDPSLLERTVYVKEEKLVAVEPAVLLTSVETSKPQLAEEKPKISSKDSLRAMVALREGMNGKLADQKEATVMVPRTTPDTLKSDTVTGKVEVKRLGEVEVKEATVRIRVRPADTSMHRNTEAMNTAIIPVTDNKMEVKQKLEEYRRSRVTKRSESSTSAGYGMTFVDEYGEGKRDTIRIVIPTPRNLPPLEQPKVEVKKEELKKDKKEEKKQVKDDRSRLDSAARGNTAKGNVKVKADVVRCVVVASESDFMKLRKKMAAQSKEEGMIEEAKKAFKSKCYTTEQVKNLGNLFLNEVGKFLFYETAYPTVSDREQFGTLQGEFKDNYFIYRFKNLVEKS